MGLFAVDYRRGSQELIAPLEALGYDVAETTLPYGDVAFTGKGEQGKSVEVGVEFKKLEELVQALKTERLQGHQLLGMHHAYDFRYLLIEGELLYDRKGHLLKRVGRREFKPIPGMGVYELLKRVHVLWLRGGLMPIWTPNRRHTLMQLDVLHKVWTDKALDEHTSHLAIYQPPALVQISQFRQTVSTLPGIGLRVSLAVEKYFKREGRASLRRAFNGDLNTWAAVEIVDKKGKTRKLGHKIAERIQEALR